MAIWTISTVFIAYFIFSIFCCFLKIFPRNITIKNNIKAKIKLFKNDCSDGNDTLLAIVLKCNAEPKTSNEKARNENTLSFVIGSKLLLCST